MKINKLPDVEYINELLYYDANEGELRWKISRSNIVKKDSIAGCLIKKGNKFYRHVSIDKKLYPAHRLIFKIHNPNWDESDLIDHKETGNPPSNHINNLRISTSQQNNSNRSIKTSTSIYKGVSFIKSKNKWKSQITFNYKNIYIGIFDCEIAAAKAYDTKATELFGHYALLNFS